MSEHARLSPSASERWLRCAASVNMTHGAGSSDSAATREGTAAHEVLENALKMWIATGDETVECADDEMRENIQEVFDYIVERYETMKGGNKVILVEQKVSLHYSTGRDDLWGKADVIIMNDKHIDVLDLKYGKGIYVEADTSQNRIYALGAMAAAMKKSKGEAPWESVRSTIIQPRFRDKDDKMVRYRDFTPDELLDWCEDVLVPAAKATDVPGEPIPGEKQCQFCPAKATCPAVAKRVQDLCSVFEPASPGALPTAEDPADMGIERLIEVHDNEPFIQGYLKAVNARLRTLLEARDPALMGKLKLIRSRQQNVWTIDQDELLTELTHGKGRILKKDLTKEVVLSAPAALKLKSLKPAQKKRMQEYIKKSEGSLTIVPDSDSRPNAFPALPFEDGLMHKTDFDFL